jgi:hypothetical protein
MERKMMIRSIKFGLLIFLSLSLLIAPSALNVKAQGMGTYIKMLNPTSGPAGTTIQLNLDVRSFINENGGLGNLQDSYGTTYKIGWDIGGWPTNSGAGLDEVRKTNWTVLGTAQLDRNGILKTTITVPNNAQVGDDHYIYAIPPKTDSGFYYWWGFFEVTSGSAASSPETTSSPTPTPIVSPDTSPTPHPINCTMTVKWDEAEFHIEIQGIAPPSSNSLLHNSREYSATFPWGTTVSLYANHTGDNANVFDGWDWTDSNGHHAQADQTVYIDLTSDVTAEPKIKGSSIPGFPIESIAIGLFLALGMLYIAKKRSKVKLPTLS